MEADKENDHSTAPERAAESRGKQPQAMKASLRDSGNELLGPVSWGTHFCQFYESKQDLLDALVPYFAAGLRNNEFCIWITSDPLQPLEAERALSAAVPGLAECKRRGQVEILPYDRWYTSAGRFDTEEVLKKCAEKEVWTLTNGFEGLRMAGNASWLDEQNRSAFLNHERTLDNVIGEHRMLAACAYPLQECALPDIVEVLDTHEFALVRSRGGWRKIAGGRRRVEAALHESESKYRVFLEQSHDSVLLLELLPAGEPVIREVNDMALKTFGYSREELVGKPVSILNENAGAARSIASSQRGKDGVSFTVSHKRKDGSVFIAEASGRELMIGGKLIAISVERDITARLKAEEALKKICSDLEADKKLLEDKDIAFREAMYAVEAEKNKLKDEIIVNINELILPILKRMRLKGGASRKYLDLLEKSLGTLISSFGRRLTEKNLKLTPKEIEISNMIKAGMATKEISGLLNVSAQTIDKHRNNIRKKLGLINKGVNLTSFLNNL